MSIRYKLPWLTPLSLYAISYILVYNTVGQWLVLYKYGRGYSYNKIIRKTFKIYIILY